MKLTSGTGRALLPSRPVAAPLTLSGNEQTPATRAAGTQGDGLTGPYRQSSIGVWEATTNLVTNGGFETNTTGHAGNAGTETVSRITTDSKFGGACLSAVTPGSGTGEGWRTDSFAISAATVYTASFWFKAPAGSTWTATWQSRDGANAFITAVADTTIVATGGWQYVSISGTSDASAAFTRINLFTRSTAQAVTLKVDGVQFENQPLSTPYVHTDGGTASRSAGRLRIPNITRYMSSSQGWIALLWQMGWGNTAEPLGGSGAIRLLAGRTDGNNSLELHYSEAVNGIGGVRVEGGAGAATSAASAAVSAGDLLFALYAFDPSRHAAAANGGAFPTPVANTAAPTIPADLDIGTRGDNFGHADSNLLFCAIGRNPSFTTGFSQALNNIARNNRIDSRPEDLPGGCTFKWPYADTDWRNGVAL